MRNVSVSVYSETSYNQTDLPRRGIVGNRPTFFPSCLLLEDYDITKIRIEADYLSMRYVDYLVLKSTASTYDNTETCYFITGINMINDNLCELSLEKDYFTTYTGGAQPTDRRFFGISGWCTRATPKTDGIFTNVIDEPFTPSKELVMDIGGFLKTGVVRESVHNIVGSTVDLDNVSYIAQSYLDSTSGNTVTVPKVPPVITGSEVNLKTSLFYRIPSLGLFDMDSEKIKMAVQQLRSLGLEDVITCCYYLPSEWGGGVTNPGTDFCGTVYGVYTSVQSTINYRTSYIARNNKVYSGQFNKFTLSSICSGDKMKYKVEEIYNTNTGASPKFLLYSDSAPKGKPYARPEYYFNNNSDIFIGAVKGSEWQNTPITLRGGSGAYIDAVNQSYSNANQGLDMSKTFLSSATGQQSLSGGINTGFALGQSALALEKSNLDFQTRNNLVEPEIRFPRDDSLQNYIGNRFYLYRTRLSDIDAERFDQFLTMYGYATSEPLTEEVFARGINFSYIQATGIRITNSSIPYRDRIGLSKQLENGIRLWNAKPNHRLYTEPN